MNAEMNCCLVICTVTPVLNNKLHIYTVLYIGTVCKEPVVIHISDPVSIALVLSHASAVVQIICCCAWEQCYLIY